MKTFKYMAALALASISTVASATVFDISFSGFVVGSETRFNCIGSAGCSGYPGPFTETLPFETAVFGNLGPRNIGDGQSISFDIGFGIFTPRITGVVTNNLGFLTGTNLNYSLNNCGAGIPSRPCSQYFGTASTFVATGGVPEPSTWAMMLIGFSAIGFGMRRRQRASRLSIA